MYTGTTFDSYLSGSILFRNISTTHFSVAAFNDDISVKICPATLHTCRSTMKEILAVVAMTDSGWYPDF